ncbi:C39 family peptidase [Nonomuraea sp. NPDC049400]|uniref:C39 family peptidase n=1 Tax=Nonomuraea sp. NPDC049400 TaxID=3364352 RepID=UPI0037A2C852
MRTTARALAIAAVAASASGALLTASPAHAVPTPTPSASPSVSPKQDLGLLAPAKASVSHPAVRQKYGMWCAPATMSVILRTYGYSRTQEQLARQMKTDNKKGTPSKNIRLVFNAYVNKKGFTMAWGETKDPGALLNNIAYDVGVLKRATAIIVDADRMPYGKVAGAPNTHMVTVRGYDKVKRTVTVWDPANNRTNGNHTVSVKALSQAADPIGYLDISR